MTVCLTKKQIDAALPKIEKGLKQYLWLQSKMKTSSHFHEDVDFRRKYNHFYKVRRGLVWRNTFYKLMAQAKKEHLQFHTVLESLRQATGRYEASFASKLVATLDTSMPVIDSVVLKNLKMRLPSATASDRAAKISKLHKNLSTCFSNFLQTENGRYLVLEFNLKYPSAEITEIKMLDLVLWQTRA